MIVVIGGRKGGTGKSTIACSLAVALAKKGRVCIFDADAQESMKDWNEARFSNLNDNDKSIDFEYGAGDLARKLVSLNKKYEYVLVDCSGKDSKEFRSALVVANKVLLPICSSPVDRRTLPYISDLLKKARIHNKKLKHLSVLSMTSGLEKKENKITRELLQELKMNPIKSSIGRRKSFKEAMGSGIGVTEQKKDKLASKEVRELAKEIIK
ncbi:MAG: division plane positioning ATPase MipZ [Oligoflexales bacterium]